jgi:hypothetical protein
MMRGTSVKAMPITVGAPAAAVHRKLIITLADSSRAVNALSDVLGRPAIGPFEDLPRRELTARPKEAS